jgi:hypothetical protein
LSSHSTDEVEVANVAVVMDVVVVEEAVVVAEDQRREVVHMHKRRYIVRQVNTESTTSLISPTQSSFRPLCDRSENKPFIFNVSLARNIGIMESLDRCGTGLGFA